MKTIADWIAVKLQEHGMAPYHLAAKMGIASTLVNSWKDGTVRPNTRHVQEMVAIWGNVS